MSLSITDLARQTGVPTSTLRYYDRLGVLASDGRGENGYRQYDDRALERLRFIGRAKELGCSLDEIAMLLTAYDEDCADVQAPLRQLVDAKIAIAHQRVAELLGLTAQLQEARHALSAEATSGPCGPGCACLAGTLPTYRSVTVIPLAASEPMIACSLSHHEMGDRLAEWQAALGHVRERSSVEGGIRLSFGADADFADVVRLARAERACCSFFAFSLTVDERGTALEVRAPGAAGELLASVFGVAA